MVCPPSRVALLNIGALLAELPLDTLQPEGDLLPAVQGAHPAPLHQTQGCVMMPCALCSVPCQTCLVFDYSQTVLLQVNNGSWSWLCPAGSTDTGCPLPGAEQLVATSSNCTTRLVQNTALLSPDDSKFFICPACRLAVIGRRSPTWLSSSARGPLSHLFWLWTAVQQRECCWQCREVQISNVAGLSAAQCLTCLPSQSYPSCCIQGRCYTSRSVQPGSKSSSQAVVLSAQSQP